MRSKLIGAALLALTLIGGAFTSCSKPQTAWITDFEAAKTETKKQRKDLLIVFTGSDWNDESKALIADVFTADFFKKAAKDYVLCNIDVVQDEKVMPKDTIDANYKLATKYNVQAMPTFVLLTPEGDLYANAALTEEAKTLDGLMTYLGGYKDARKKLVDLKNKVKSSSGANKAKAIDAFLEVIDSSQRESYGEMIRQVPSLDKDNKAGLRGKYQLQVAYLDAIALYQKGSMTEAGDCFIKLAEEATLDPGQSQEAWYMGAYMYALSGTADNAKVVGWLEKAVAADPKNPGATQIQATIDQLKATPASTPAAKGAAKK
jgi:thioredoxin-related protein